MHAYNGYMWLSRSATYYAALTRVSSLYTTIKTTIYHYQNAYASAFRNAFLELLRLSSRVRVEGKALSLRSCIEQFDP